MTIRSSRSLVEYVLEARVVPHEDGYLATVERLSLEVTGDSVETAQDNLINRFRSWLESREEAEDLAESLAQVGISGVQEDTELELHFVE